MMRDDFAVFILTHGRPDKMLTVKVLEDGNYTGKLFIVIDNEDEEQEEYKRIFGDKVIVFNKTEAAKIFDVGDNFPDHRGVVYARNAVFDIAKNLGIEYFLVLDDDYFRLGFRIERNNKLYIISCRQLDRLFELMIDFLEVSGAITVAFAQGGDYIGGKDSPNMHPQLKRKAMNTFFCKTTRRFNFSGRINEDVNAYVTLGIVGKLLFTVTMASITQIQTQQNKGGLTELYLDKGTYVKSFYTVMYAPSAVKISMMGDKNMRIHHRVNWNNCVPKIIREKYKKAYLKEVEYGKKETRSHKEAEEQKAGNKSGRPAED
jgi:hypothetical protein